MSENNVDSSENSRKFILSQQALIFNESNQVLILRHSKKENHWLFPGGRVDEHEKNLFDALAREIKEEINLDLESIDKIVWYDQSMGGSTLAILFEVKVKEIQNLRLSAEHCDFKWINVDDPTFQQLMYYKNLAKKVSEIYGIM